MFSAQNFGFLVIGVAVFGGLGSVIRLGLSHWHSYLPWGILLGNTLASGVVGFVYPLAHSGSVGWVFWGTLLATGLAGGLSTFSSWAAQTLHLMVNRESRQGFLNFVLNLALPVIAAVAGMILGSILLK